MGEGEGKMGVSRDHAPTPGAATEKEPLPLRPYRRINFDLLFRHVAGRYPRTLKRLSEDD